MISLKSKQEIELMRRAGKITAAARALAGEMVTPGVTTQEIDQAVYQFIKSQGAEPSFLNYQGYPASVCVSVNDEVIHGIPGKRVLREGDIVSIDVGAFKDGFHGDCAATFACGVISEEAKRLIQVTRQSFFEGLKFAREGYRVPDISRAIQAYVEENGFSVVRSFVGHGVGKELHEDPEVPNFGRAGRGPRLVAGMTLSPACREETNFGDLAADAAASAATSWLWQQESEELTALYCKVLHRSAHTEGQLRRAAGFGDKGIVTGAAVCHSLGLRHADHGQCPVFFGRSSACCQQQSQTHTTKFCFYFLLHNSFTSACNHCRKSKAKPEGYGRILTQAKFRATETEKMPIERRTCLFSAPPPDKFRKSPTPALVFSSYLCPKPKKQNELWQRTKESY